ncbi:MAG: hypothetical protein IT368_12630 [Candidatus Hydrogenedentes bacterium]|nr:hypothetical protein [Candidatus Hydrogenedentota bacterium]
MRETMEMVLADIAARVIYFLAGAIGAGLILMRDAHVFLGAGGNLPLFVLLVLGTGTLCALFGPGLYDRHVMRGRGTLQSVRNASRRKPVQEQTDDP